MEEPTFSELWFEDDEYEHIRPLARIFRNVQLIGTNSTESQGHFVHPEFIAAIYWTNGINPDSIPAQIRIPATDNAVKGFVTYLEKNSVIGIPEQILREMMSVADFFDFEEFRRVLKFEIKYGRFRA